MIVAAIAIAGILLVMWLVQFATTLSFLADCKRTQQETLSDAELPNLAVLMPLRGDDPFLADAIRSVLKQDYPNLRLHVILDREDDLAGPVVRHVIDAWGDSNVHVSHLHKPRRNCSLFCSTIVQFLDEIDESVEVTCIVAADMVLPKTWCRTMAGALADPNVVTTLGNRWYKPARGKLGSLVRRLWTAIGVPDMWKHRLLWSGAMMLRVSDIRELKLDEIWAHSMTEDASANMSLLHSGRRIKFVPELISVNREEISLSGCLRFMIRQMYWYRLYQTDWWRQVFNACVCGLTTLAAIAMIPLGIAFGSPHNSLIAAGGLTVHILGVLWMTWLIDRRISRILRNRSETVPPLPAKALALLPLAVPLTYILYLLTVVACSLKRHVNWRGIRYRIGASNRVEMIEYKPFERMQESVTRDVSI